MPSIPHKMMLSHCQSVYPSLLFRHCNMWPRELYLPGCDSPGWLAVIELTITCPPSSRTRSDLILLLSA
jgi:hypothetical protein